MSDTIFLNDKRMAAWLTRWRRLYVNVMVGPDGQYHYCIPPFAPLVSHRKAVYRIVVTGRPRAVQDAEAPHRASQ